MTTHSQTKARERVAIRVARWLLCLQGEHRWEYRPRADRCRDCGQSAWATDFVSEARWIAKGLLAMGGVPASWVGRLTPEYRQRLEEITGGWSPDD